MTDERKKELEKLEKADLIALIDAEECARAESEGKFAKERARIMKEFLDSCTGEGSDPSTGEGDAPGDPFIPLEKNKSFDWLKKRIF